jgi:hypothetical protein
MTVTPYSLVATYLTISTLKIHERRINLIRKASRSICQTTRCHTPKYSHHGEHNFHNADPALKSTGRGPTALLLELQKDGIPSALFCVANGKQTRGQSMQRLQNCCQHCVYKMSRLVVTGIGHPLYRHPAKHFPRKGQDHELSHSLPDPLFTNYPPSGSTASELLAAKLRKAEVHTKFTLNRAERTYGSCAQNGAWHSLPSNFCISFALPAYLCREECVVYIYTYMKV